jgi:hypothetical protein
MENLKKKFIAIVLEFKAIDLRGMIDPICL